MPKNKDNGLSVLGKYTKKNQHHTSGISGNKQPETPPTDVTQKGGWPNGSKRPADKDTGKDPIDVTTTDYKDESKDLEDMHDEHEGIMKGKASKKFGQIVRKKLEESVNFTVDSSQLKSILEGQTEDTELLEQAIEVFDASVTALISEQVDNICEAAIDCVEEIVESELAEMENDIADYLDAAILEWAEDNRLALEENVRVNVAESFMDNLIDLLESHNIAIPEESVNMYEHAVEVGNKLMEDFNELQAENEQLSEMLSTTLKESMISDFIDNNNMTIAESERLRKVAKELSFNTPDDFENKLVTLAESFVTPTVSNDYNLISEDVYTEDNIDYLEEDDDYVNRSGNSFVDAIARSIPVNK